VNGHSKDILMNSKGEVAEVEEEVAMAGMTLDVKRAVGQGGNRQNRQNRVRYKEGPSRGLRSASRERCKEVRNSSWTGR